MKKMLIQLSREGRVTFIPKAKSIFNLNRSAIEETKTLPIWSRWLFLY